MDEPSDRRRYPRMSTHGEAYGVTCSLRERPLQGARLANLSACGCGLELEISEARDLDMGALLEELYIDHPELPLVPLQGSVVRLLGKIPGKTSGYLLAGVEFTSITPFIQNLIDEHVRASLEI